MHFAFRQIVPALPTLIVRFGSSLSPSLDKPPINQNKARP